MVMKAYEQQNPDGPLPRRVTIQPRLHDPGRSRQMVFWYRNDFSEKIPHINKRSKYVGGALISSEKPATPVYLEHSVEQSESETFFSTSSTVLWKRPVCEEMAGCAGTTFLTCLSTIPVFHIAVLCSLTLCFNDFVFPC